MTATAECNPPGADLSFRGAVPYAGRLIVGTVIETVPEGSNSSDGASYRFTVAVDQVLRGAAATVVTADHLETGGCIRWLSATKGDRIALAMDIRAADSSIPTNTAAWITGMPPASGGYETVTFTELHDLVQLKAPDTSTDPGHTDREAPTPLVLLVAIVIVTVAAVWRRTRPLTV